MRSVHDWLCICLRAVWKSTLARQAEALHLPKNPLTPAVYAGLMQRFIFLLGHCYCKLHTAYCKLRCRYGMCVPPSPSVVLATVPEISGTRFTSLA